MRLFVPAVRGFLKDDYQLENGKSVKGQSLTYIRSCLQDEGFRGLSGYRIEDRLKAAGFEISFGRGWRRYHNGHRGLGVTCSVVYEKDTSS